MEKDNSRRKHNFVVSERFLFEKNAYPVKPQDVTVQLCTDSDGALPSKYRGKNQDKNAPGHTLDLRPTTLKSSRSRMVRFGAEDISTHGVGLQ